ncbi:sugar O-acetyltransferase [Bradyrhizobium sp. LHD-71]|uniref:sugar O-acetyltransferase n=1 Tax=Bradyrhizobium sp. LHD-71 TaxID=3072141 RepID=UPI00280E5B49|nr:sugar O-acetyltransferase [Bradyrhizobium sp. LHD-71]MDQ8730828.1 sugar O-acetyltransferase [Bradyrhizobium sp. LHD-71]
MSGEGGVKIIPVRTPESKQFVADVERAMTITSALNRLTYTDADEVRSLFEELAGQRVGDHFRLVPPFYTDCGKNIRIGSRVFINQNCTFYALAEIAIGDDVMIGPNVSLITSEHPVAPSQRRAYLLGRPITIEKGVWIAAGATVIGGVTVGENSVVAAGSVVTRDVPANTLVGGNPARVIRSIEGE